MSLMEAIRRATKGTAGKKPAGKMAERDEEEIVEDEEEEETDEPAAETDENEEEAAEDEETEDEVAAEEEEDEEAAAAAPKAAAAGRRIERRRIGAILGSEHAERAPELAAHLAFETSMSASKAVAALAKAPAASAGGLRNKMAGRQQPKLGSGASAGEPKGVARFASSYRKAGQGHRLRKDA